MVSFSKTPQVFSRYFYLFLHFWFLAGFKWASSWPWCDSFTLNRNRSAAAKSNPIQFHSISFKRQNNPGEQGASIVPDYNPGLTVSPRAVIDRRGCLALPIKACVRLKVCNWPARHVRNSQMSLKLKKAEKVQQKAGSTAACSRAPNTEKGGN